MSMKEGYMTFTLVKLGIAVLLFLIKKPACKV